MTAHEDVPTVVRVEREIAADPATIFEQIADPARQPTGDGNDNLADAAAGQRVHAVGEVFSTTLTRGAVRENHVVEFEEGRRIAWTPAEPGGRPPGHLWRWELEPLGPGRTRVTHTYDWTHLADETRFERARATTSEKLRASLDGLAAVVESQTRTTIGPPLAAYRSASVDGREPSVTSTSKSRTSANSWKLDTPNFVCVPMNTRRRQVIR